MVKLVMQCTSSSFCKYSYYLTNWYLIGEQSSNNTSVIPSYYEKHPKSISIGGSTLGAHVLFKLFVRGKRVYGDSEKLIVRISQREVRVFKLLKETGVYHKRKMWQDFLRNKVSKKDMLKKLEDELTVCLLSQKLEGKKK